jgi:intein/homing endonuclease
MVKLTYSCDISDSVGVGGEIVKSASELKKQASTIFNCEYDELKPPEGKTGIHLVAIGDMETYGFNRNADGFKQADCRDRCDTFVKYGHVFQHHRNKDPEKALGEIKRAAYNPDMHRVELYIWADNEKSKDHLERLEKTGEVSFSMACFRAGTPVLTTSGFVPIEDISVGTKVFTHTGKWKTVTHTMYRKSPDYYELSLVSWGSRVIGLTGNHRVLAASFDDVARKHRKDRVLHPGDAWRRRHRSMLHTVAKWKEAKDLTSYDYLCVPIPQSLGKADADNIRWARMLGYYTAEGSISSHGNTDLNVTITCNANDCFVDEIETLAKWTSVSRKSHRLSDKAVVLNCFGKDPCRRIFESCGRGCGHKRIPPEILTASPDEKFNFAAAWFNGDGWQDKGGMHWSIKSPVLSAGLQMLLASIGVPSACTKIDHPEDRGCVKSKNAYEHVVSVSNEYSELFSDISKAKIMSVQGRSKLRTFISGGYLMVPVKEVKHVGRKTRVYNLSVEGDESYTAYGFAVHNCTVPTDTCSLCGATRTGPGDPNECEHIKYQLGKIAEDGKFIGMINNEPRWFDISFVGRPADRIAWSLKTASGLDDSIKQAEYEGVVPPDELAITSEHGLRKLATIREMADMASRMSGWLKTASFASTDERRLFEMRKLAALNVPDSILSDLRAYSPKDAFEGLADAGVVLDVPSFFKYAMGPEFPKVQPYIEEIEVAVPQVLEKAVKEGSCSGFCNSTEFEPYDADDLRRNPLPQALVMKLAEYGCDNSTSKIMDITLSGKTPTFSVDANRRNSVISIPSTKLAEKYVTYKLAAVDAVLNSRYGVNRNKNNLAAISAAQDLKSGETDDN